MTYIKQNIKHLRLINGYSQEKLAELLNVSRDNIASYERGTEPKIEFILNIVNFFHISINDFFKTDLSTYPNRELITPFVQGNLTDRENTFVREDGVVKLISPAKQDESPPITSNAIAIGEIKKPEDQSPYIDLGNDQFLMVVPLIPIRASAGYREHYGEDDYVNDHYGKHYFPVTRQYRGKYFAFVVDGDSMDDGTSEAIIDGSTVTARDIQSHLWKSKFHLHSFKDFVIVLKDAIIVKRIIEHDTINGTIVCHSLNPDKRRFTDFTLQLDECLQILNIVNVTQPR